MYPITTATASLLALIYIFLSIKVITLRKQHKISLGGQGHNDLEMAIRAHSNFSEYVPITLILSLAAEANLANPIVLTVLLFIFIIGRLLHAIAFLYNKKHFKLRTLGMVSTFIIMTFLSILNFWLILG